jgi:murein L,D-transpeptidase YafK
VRCDRILWIEVRKSERRLDGACEGGARVSWTVAVGREPRGAKRARGDHRTPEGLYHVVGTHRPSRFRRFVAIDYPSRADAEQARAEGRLSAHDFTRIVRAHEAGATPPGDTPLGGGLGFHGEGERWRGDSVDLDWTDGCLAMTDPDIDFLAARTRPGTPVRILP